MKAFVTGANGFIGSNLVKGLRQKNYSVKSLVLHGTDIKNIENSGCEIVYGNMMNVSEFDSHLEGIETVFHLAARVSDWGKWEDFYKLNVEATKNLINSAIKHKVKRFIFVSSLAIHKPRGYTDGDENAPRDNVKFNYAISKILIEDYLNECFHKNLIESVIIRPGVFPFGPEDRTSFYKIARAMEKGLFGYVNGGKALLCTAYVENLVEGIILASEKENAAGKTYIIGDNIKISWREIIELFAKYLNVNLPKISIPYFVAKPIAIAMEKTFKSLSISTPPPLTDYRISLVAKDFYFSSEKAIKELGYKPTVSLEEGIRKTVNWYHSLLCCKK